MKKNISIVMAAIMVALMIPMSALAASKIVVPPGGKPDRPIGTAPLKDTIEYTIHFESGLPMFCHVTQMPNDISVEVSLKDAIKGIEYTLLSSVPKADGFIFLGWSTKENATTPEYGPDATIKMNYKNRNLTLYGVWKDIHPVEQSATITYDCSQLEPPSGYNINNDNIIVQRITWKAPVGEGYNAPLMFLKNDAIAIGAVFAGWKNAKTGEMVTGTTITVHNGDNIRLVAVWNYSPNA